MCSSDEETALSKVLSAVAVGPKYNGCDLSEYRHACVPKN